MHVLLGKGERPRDLFAAFPVANPSMEEEGEVNLLLTTYSVCKTGQRLLYETCQLQNME